MALISQNTYSQRIPLLYDNIHSNNFHHNSLSPNIEIFTYGAIYFRIQIFYYIILKDTKRLRIQGKYETYPSELLRVARDYNITQYIECFKNI